MLGSILLANFANDVDFGQQVFEFHFFVGRLKILFNGPMKVPKICRHKIMYLNSRNGFQKKIRTYMFWAQTSIT